jgi:uncharacterized membrane protein
MSYKTYRMIQAFNGMFLGAIMAVSIILGNWIIPIIVIIISLSVMMVLRRRVKEIVTDERTCAITDKAARFTFQIVTIGMAVIGAVLLAASRGESPGLTQAGFAMEYAVCALLVINMLAYTYYSRKLGGK